MKPLNAKEFRENYELLYSRYGGRLYNYVLKISHGNKYLAEEITQTAFIRLWERRESISDADTMASYLFTIARHLFFNICEHDAVEHVYFNYIINTRSDSDSSTEEHLDSRFLMAHINEIVALMPEMRRKVFVMSRFQHMSNKQIAETMGISVNTVETHMLLAMRFLREQLVRRYGSWVLALSLITSITM